MTSANPSDAISPGPGETTVEICARPPHTSYLAVDYQGRRPPVALFADLEMIGWQPPVASPPPKAAIDWDTPDPATGERFTVRDYQVTGAIVEPPRGSGPRGTWTPHEGDAFLRALHGVLRRHGVALAGDAVDPSLPPPPSAPPPPKAARTTLRTRARDLAAAAAPPPDAPSGTETSIGALSTVMAIPDGGYLQLAGTTAPARVPAVEDALRELGVRFSLASVQEDTIQTFRGSQTTVPVERFLVEALAPAALAAAAIDLFADHDISAKIDILTASAAQERLRAAVEAEAAEEEDDEDDELTLISRAHPCVHLIVDPARIEAVARAVDQLGLQHWQRTPTEVDAMTSFRGSQTVTRRPAMAFEVWSPPQHAVRVLAELASAAGLDPARQPERAFLTEPVAAASTPEPAGEADPRDPPTAADESDGELELDELAALDGLTPTAPPPLVSRVRKQSDSGDEVLIPR